MLATWSLLGLPRVARWFFARVGTDRAYRFVFGIGAFLVGGVLAEAAGIDGIVGAFFAGLGLNRAVPEESPLMDRLQFMGSTLFIPIFLVSVGVLLEPKVMVDPKTLLVALVFTVAVLGGKALAAVVAGRTFHFTWPEVGVMSGLSGSQAAATLATTLVGAKLGLFDTTTINAVLVVILASLVITPLMVSKFGKHVPSAVEDQATLGKTVLVPVWDEIERRPIRLAGRLATSDGGIVLAASFANAETPPTELKTQRHLTTQAEEWLAKEGLESRTLFRVAPTVPEGLLETILGENATLLVTEWRMRERIEPDSEASEAIARSPAPILMAHGDVESFERILIVVRRDELVRPGRQDVELAAQLASRFAPARPDRDRHRRARSGARAVRQQGGRRSDRDPRPDRVDQEQPPEDGPPVLRGAGRLAGGAGARPRAGRRPVPGGDRRARDDVSQARGGRGRSRGGGAKPQAAPGVAANQALLLRGWSARKRSAAAAT